MEVIAVSEIYVDGSRIAHRGAFICKKTHANCTCTGDETWSIILPDHEGNSKLLFQTKDVKKTFLYQEKRIIGFQLSSNKEIESFILDIAACWPKDEFRHFMKIFSQMFPNTDSSVTVTTLNNQREAKKYVTSNFPRGIDVWRKVFSVGGKIKGSVRMFDLDLTPTENFFRPYLRCYVDFVKKNSVSERDSKNE